MDQRTLESLLRRLVERVEDSERGYTEALNELHARLDQLSRSTEAGRQTGSTHTSTFNRLHDEVSDLARRLDEEAETPLDDFERLGRALSSGMGFGGLSDPLAPTHEPEVSPTSYSGLVPGATLYPYATSPDFGLSGPKEDYSAPSQAAQHSSEALDYDLEKRLVEMAQQLEQSIGTAMPTVVLETLNARLDDIGHQLTQALQETPKRESLNHVERQLSDMSRQLGKAENHLAKVSGIESQLLGLIDRFDEKPPATAQLAPDQLQEIVTKAANEAARFIASETTNTVAAQKLDAMQRDLAAMSDKSKESSERIASTLQAVHESLKQLVHQIEPGLQPKPRMPFVERARAAIPDFQESEPARPFGRAKRSHPDDQAVELDSAQERKIRGAPNSEMDSADDLVAAARRAAQAAAMRAEERGSRRARQTSGPLAGTTARAEATSRRKRSVLIIAAAVLLLLSAALLYGRLKSKPEVETTPAASEQTTPAPARTSEGAPTESDDGESDQRPDQSGSWEAVPDFDESPADASPTQTGQTSGFTEIAKSRVPVMPVDELKPEPQPASLKPAARAELPPGVMFSVEDPNPGGKSAAQGDPAPALSVPTALPLPPAELDPLALRESAANGDAKAQ
ncbi:MAG: hypothetical protein ACREDO_03110 [Methyloceanibacter sp.]